MQNKYRSLRSAAVRPHNRRLVLQLLRANGGLTRPTIAAASGLSPAAVSSVVGGLIGDGLVTETTPSPSASRRPVGRPATTLQLDARARCVLAVQIGARLIQVGITELDAGLLAHASMPLETDEPAERTLDGVASALRRMIDDTGRSAGDVLGVGVGAAGLVDRAGRRNVVAANSGWRDVPIADLLEGALDLPVTVDHNVRAMAMGEARYGHGTDVESLMYVYARSGLGVGLVLEGNPYRGGRLGSHEIAHIAVPSGTDCTCGKRGCVETVVSDRGLLRQLRAAGLTESSEIDADVIDRFVAAVERGDSAACDVRDEIVSALATALAASVELVDPQLVVVGGLLDECQAVLLDELRIRTAERVTPWTRSGLRIVSTAFGAASGLVGAATLALDTFLFGMTPLRESIVDARLAANAAARRTTVPRRTVHTAAQQPSRGRRTT